MENTIEKGKIQATYLDKELTSRIGKKVIVGLTNGLELIGVLKEQGMDIVIIEDTVVRTNYIVVVKTIREDV